MEDLIVESCTIADNQVTNTAHGGISWHPSFSTPTDTIMQNNIVFGNAGISVSTNVSQSTFRYNCVENWAGSGSGNISDDPAFASTATYALESSSPFVDTGTNQPWMVDAEDYEGKPRILMCVADRGAVEYFEGVRIHYMESDGSVITNTFGSLPVAVYQMFEAVDLVAADWMPLGPPFVATGTVSRSHVPLSDEDSRTFYRVDLVTWP